MGDPGSRQLLSVSELTRTVQRLQERGRHLKNMFTMPEIGYLFRAMWKYETS